ncbi:MAG TPA: DUF6701 domain-containing protein [Rhodocyclaceae bacterium]
MSALRWISHFLRGLALILLLGVAPAIAADKCSSTWLGKVWLNEYNFGTNPFVEIYSKDASFPASWQNWTIEVYDSHGLMIPTITLSNASGAFACTKSGNKTWVTKDITDNQFSGNAGLAVLKDSSGKFVDAYAFDNSSPPNSWKNSTSNYDTILANATNGCSYLTTWLNYQATQSGTKPNQPNMMIWSSQGNKDYSRVPDGGSGNYSSGNSGANGNSWYITSQTGAGTTYTTCTSNNANFTKSVDYPQLPVSGTATFSLTFSNPNSGAIVGSIYVVDTLPPGMTFVSATSSNSADTLQYSTDGITYGSTVPASVAYVKWTPANVAGGSSTVLKIKMTVPAAATVGTVYTNNATTGGLALTVQQTDSAAVTVVSATTPSFLISAAPSASCTSASGSLRPVVTVTAKDSLNGTGSTLDASSPAKTYTGTAYLGTSSGKGTWALLSGSGTFSATNKTYTFVAADKGVASFYLTDSTVETIDVTATDAVTYASSGVTMSGLFSSIIYGANCTLFDHVEFSHDGAATTIAAEPVTIYACTGTASCQASSANQYTGGSFVVTLTAISGASWCSDAACANVISGTITASNGTVLYLKDTTARTDRLAGTSANASNTTVQCKNTSAGTFNSTTACDLVFSGASSGFDVVEHSSGTATAPQTPLYTKVSGSAFTVDVLATSNSGTTVATGYTGTVSVTLVDGTTGGGACASMTPLSSVTLSPASPYTFVAGDAGRKTFTITASGAARNAYVRVSDGTTTTCSYDNFAIRPAKFVVTSSDAAYSGSAWPAIKAGRSFTLTARGVQLDGSSTAVGYDGAPALNGKATDGFVVGTATAGSALNLSGGGSFGSATASTSSASNSFTYDEVGYFGLLANAVQGTSFAEVDIAKGECIAGSFVNGSGFGNVNGCYIGSAAVTYDATAHTGFGRFIPDYFDVVSHSFSASPCASGTTNVYMDQAFSLVATIEALNASGVIVTNYTGSYATGTVGLEMENAHSGSAVTHSRLTLGAANWSAGSYTFSATKFARLSTPDGPYSSLDIGVSVSDETGLPSASRPYVVTRDMNELTTDCTKDTNGHSDGTCTAVKLGTLDVRFGRLRLLSAYGSELLPLQVPVRAEYYDSATSSWAINTTDSCTTIPATAVALGDNSLTTSVTAGPTLSNGVGTITLDKPSGAGKVDLAINLGSGVAASTACMGTAWASGPTGGSAPTNTLTHLAGNWCGGTYDKAPSARVKFGAAKAPYLYYRERY